MLATQAKRNLEKDWREKEKGGRVTKLEMSGRNCQGQAKVESICVSQLYAPQGAKRISKVR